MQNRLLLASSLVAAATIAACNGSPLDPGTRVSGSGSGGAAGSTSTMFGDTGPIESDVSTGPSAPVPDTTPVVLAESIPRPLSGGTMIVASNGRTAIAADPDRDTIWWGAIDDPTSVASIALEAGEEPGRLVEDDAGLVHVLLRGAGAIATVDLAAAKVVRRTNVCAAPRGLAHDTKSDTLIVACAGGELVTLAATDDSISRSLQLDRDLRDVVALDQGFLALTSFRTAELLLIDPAGKVRSRGRLGADDGMEADVAWRMVRVPGSPASVAISHQEGTTSAVPIQVPGGYEGFGPSIVRPVLTLATFDLGAPDASPLTQRQAHFGALPVDVAVAPNGALLAVALHGAPSLTAFTSPDGVLSAVTSTEPIDSAPTSIAFDAQGRAITFSREPAVFIRVDLMTHEQTRLPIDSAADVADTGHRLFHSSPTFTGDVACASCHPEGRDDGRVWTFDALGNRRTPSLVGGVLATAPFHWQGDLPDLDQLMSEVFTRRMGGNIEDAKHVAALARFLDAIKPVPRVSPSSSAIDHGKQLFESADVGCSSCHSGAHFTNNATVDVGTGLPLQVPSLIGVGMRAPYLHEGCAPTLLDRFGACGGGDRHGTTSQLSPSDLADLASYLDTL